MKITDFFTQVTKQTKTAKNSFSTGLIKPHTYDSVELSFKGSTDNDPYDDLLHAINDNNIERARQALQSGADSNGIGDMDLLPLEIANTPKMIELLYKEGGARLEEQDPDGYTPLLHKASELDPLCFWKLVELGADINAEGPMKIRVKEIIQVAVDFHFDELRTPASPQLKKAEKERRINDAKQKIQTGQKLLEQIDEYLATGKIPELT